MVDSRSAQTKKLRALIVIEDGESRRRLTELLAGQGMQITELADGEDPLDSVRSGLPDLVLVEDGATTAGLADSLRDDVSVRHAKLVAIAAGEADQSVLDRVLAALGPRLDLEAGLDGAGGVSGRIEEVGARALLEAISRRRRDRKLTVWIEHETLVAEFRGGELYTLEYTDLHGDPCSGPAALEKLLTLDEAVFEVAPLAEDPDRQFQLSVRAEIDAACRRLSGTATAADLAAGAGAEGAVEGGQAKGGLGTKVAVAVVLLLVLGAGVFFGVRYLVFGSAEEGEHDQPLTAAGDAEYADGGPGSAATISEDELKRLEAALRRGAASIKAPAGVGPVPTPAVEGEADGGAPADGARPEAETAANDEAPPGEAGGSEPRPGGNKKPGAKGAPTQQPAPKGQQGKPPKKKGDPDVEAMIDDLGIDFE